MFQSWFCFYPWNIHVDFSLSITSFLESGFGGLPILAGQARCLSLVPAFAKAQLLLVLLLLLRFAPLVARFPLWHVGCPSLLLVFGLCSLTHVAGGFSWRCVLFALLRKAV